MKYASALTAALVMCTGGVAAAAPDRYPAASSPAARIVVESDPGAQLTGVQIFIGAGLERQTTANAGIAALVAESILSTPVEVDGVRLPLLQAAERIPASISYAIDARNVHFFVEAPPARMGDALGLLGKALKAPSFTSATLADARRSLAARGVEAESNPFFVGTQMARRGYYLGGAGTATYPAASAFDSLGPRDLAAFFSQYYVRNSFSASSTGLQPPDLTSALAGLAAVLPDTQAPAPDRRVAAFAASGVKRIVARRDIGSSLTVLAFAAPAPDSKDFGPMLLVQTLLSTVFDTSLGSTPQAISRSVQAFYQYDAQPASFVVIVNGARIDRSTGIGEVLLVTKSLAKSQLDAKTLEQLKVQARGALLSATLGLGDRAYLLGTLSSQGVPTDSLNAALDAIDAATPADVQRLATAYLQKFIVAEVIPRDDVRGG